MSFKKAITHSLHPTNMVTYAMKGTRGSGVMCLNGAAARHGRPGDIIMVIAYGYYEDSEARHAAHFKC